MKATGICRFAADPELKETKDGVCLSEFVLVFNEKRKVGDKLLEQAHFFDCVIWDKAAKVVCDNFEKGDLIYIVQATPRQDRWLDKDNNKRSRIIFRIDSFEFIPFQKRKETTTIEQNGEHDIQKN